jgi:small subunit ribosomal protein S8
MSMQDPIADMLTRIRNANRVGRKAVLVKASKVCRGIAEVLEAEGYIDGFDEVADENPNKQGDLRVKLKYTLTGEKAIREIKRLSKPGRRVYSGVGDMPSVLGGLGINVVSTSRGVMSDRKCRQEKVGGELLCQVA